MAKQIMNVRDVMAVLEMSESKAYGILWQMNDELKAKGFLRKSTTTHKMI